MKLPYSPDSLVAQSPAWTYRDFEQRALQISTALQQQKVRAISIWLEDAAVLACTLLAAWHANVKVLFLPNSTPESLAWAAENADFLLVDNALELTTAQPSAVQFSAFATDVDLQNLAEIRPLVDRQNQTELWLKTSGSSGEAKTIVKTAAEIWLSADVLAKALPFAAHNQITAISTVSIQHIYGLTVHIMMSLVNGWQLGRKQLFFPDCVSVESRQTTETVLISSPAMLSRINWQTAQLPKVVGVISSGGALAESDSTMIRDTIQQPVVEIYGSTETGPIAIRQDIGLWQTLPLSEIGTDENGALWLEAAWAKDRQQTADAVEIQADGFKLLGRIDRIVKVGDKRTSLVSVEQDLVRSELVSDCYIAKHPTEQRLAAWVELTADGITQFREQGRRAVSDALKMWLAKTQEKTAIPRFWRFTDKLPRNSQSKISRLEFEQICTQPQIDPIWQQEVRSENQLFLQGKVPLDLTYFKGHFANFPLVPGVVELQWVSDQIERYFGHKVKIERVDNLKFQKFLRPNDEMELTLKWDEAKSRMGFQLKTENEMCGSGLIVLER